MNIAFKIVNEELYYFYTDGEFKDHWIENIEQAKVFEFSGVLKSNLTKVNRFISEYNRKVWLESGASKQEYIDKMKRSMTNEMFLLIIRCDHNRIKLEMVDYDNRKNLYNDIRQKEKSRSWNLFSGGKI